jgi:hypothetical protein
MPRLNGDQRSALAYWWNLVSDAARSGFTATETSQIAASIAAETGRKVSFKEYTAIAQLYGYARREINASEAFGNASPGSTITPSMVSVPPYARDDREQNGYPLYHVKFYYTYLDAQGKEQTDIKTSVQAMNLPQTVGEIHQFVSEDAEALGAKYGHQVVSSTPFAVLAV